MRILQSTYSPRYLTVLIVVVPIFLIVVILTDILITPEPASRVIGQVVLPIRQGAAAFSILYLICVLLTAPFSGKNNCTFLAIKPIPERLWSSGIHGATMLIKNVFWGSCTFSALVASFALCAGIARVNTSAAIMGVIAGPMFGVLFGVVCVVPAAMYGFLVGLLIRFMRRRGQELV